MSVNTKDLTKFFTALHGLYQWGALNRERRNGEYWYSLNLSSVEVEPAKPLKKR